MTAHTARFDAPYEERPRRRGLFSDWLGGGRSDAGYLRQEPEREFTARHAPEEPVRLLADGDAFQFRVYPTFEWRGLAQSRDDLVAATSPLMGRARRTLANVLRPMARSFEPHRAREFETAANKRADGQSWTIHDEGRGYSLGFTVTVQPDELVQEQLRPYWEARIKSECDHKLGLQRARQVDQLTRQWSIILDQLEQDPRTLHAAQLSEADFARVFGMFVDGRRKEVHDLLDLLRNAVNAHGDVGLGPSEFTRAWDQALKMYQRRHGFQPDPDE